MSQFNISQSLIDRYAAGPSKSKIDDAKVLREAVESALGGGYQVFLQGSHRNNTGVADLNDVDIVALSETVHSTLGGPPATNPISWDEVFARVERSLAAHWRFAGLVKRGDKCIKVATDLALDVVPAIYRRNASYDPIEIYSFREQERRDNYPRDHWTNGVAKNSASQTNGSFKPTVRLMKRWARNVLGDLDVAPSFYLECAIYNVPDDCFNNYLPLSLAKTGLAIHEWSRSKYISSVAHDKDILVANEWAPNKFEQFKAALLPSLSLVLDAMNASTSAEADRLWRKAFGE